MLLLEIISTSTKKGTKKGEANQIEKKEKKEKNDDNFFGCCCCC